ncbi:MAG: hypothetical protein O6768_03610 [Planctomycetota bacterium]|nr:hypothetical protein [Planctomycetota bacterium]
MHRKDRIRTLSVAPSVARLRHRLRRCVRPGVPAGGVGVVLVTAWTANGDGTVGILDLLTLLANWGPCP